MRIQTLKTAFQCFATTALIFAVQFTAGAQELASMTTLVDNGDPSNRVDIVFVADGYTEEKMPIYHRLVDRAIDQMAKIEPFRSYWQYMNFHRLDVHSNEYGVTLEKDGETTTVDTAFNTVHQPDESLYLDAKFSKVLKFAARHAPDVDVAVCIFPDVDGGVANGKTCFVGGSSFWRNTAAHEVGHSLGGVADEYVGTLDETPGWRARLGEFVQRRLIPGPFEGANNVTTATKRSKIPWKHWIKEDTPIPTPDDVRAVGLYRGARYDPDDYYRSQYNCLMKSSSTTSKLCVACGEQTQLRICRKVMPLTYRHSQDGADATFNVTSIIPGPTAIRWYLNGKEIAKAKLELTLTAKESEKKSTHKVQVEILDASAMVRADPESVLLYGHVWTVEMGNNELRVKKHKSVEMVTGLLGWFRESHANFHGNWPRTRIAQEEFAEQIVPESKPSKPNKINVRGLSKTLDRFLKKGPR